MNDDSSILNEINGAGGSGRPLPTSIIVPFPVERSTSSISQLPTTMKTESKTSPESVPTEETTSMASTATSMTMQLETTTMAPAQRPVPSNALICVVHEDFNRTSLAFPPDGLCDLMFFDSLLTQGGNRLAPPYQENFQYFLDTAQQHNSTEYGVGFDYGSIINAAASAVSSDEKVHLEYIWKSRVYHYGNINSPMRSLTMTNLLQLLNKLMPFGTTMGVWIGWGRFRLNHWSTFRMSLQPFQER
ncbi:hypothetical protein MTO96_048931 [Rhipicephalus appendiculatus]